MSLLPLLTEIRACTECQEQLPHAPRPVVQAGSQARILIIGQAPGRRVHHSGIPWDDPSGERLRSWLTMDQAQFYDESITALVPMGFCYPGTGTSGDAPPRPECAAMWHQRLLDQLQQVEVTLLIGRYAQNHYLPDAAGQTVTSTVQAWRQTAPAIFPLPHPSPRNNRWLKNNPWFETELLPKLQRVMGRTLINKTHRKNDRRRR